SGSPDSLPYEKSMTWNFGETRRRDGKPEKARFEWQWKLDIMANKCPLGVHESLDNEQVQNLAIDADDFLSRENSFEVLLSYTLPAEEREHRQPQPKARQFIPKASGLGRYETSRVPVSKAIRTFLCDLHRRTSHLVFSLLMKVFADFGPQACLPSLGER